MARVLAVAAGWVPRASLTSTSAVWARASTPLTATTHQEGSRARVVKDLPASSVRLMWTNVRRFLARTDLCVLIR